MNFVHRFNDFEKIINDCFPSVLRDAIMEVSRYMQTPAPLVLNAVLASISASAQGIADVEIYSGSRKPISLFLAAIEESGDRKTSIDEIFAAPFKQYDSEAIKRYREETAQWKLDRQTWMNKKKKAQRDFNKEKISEEQLQEVINSEPKKPVLQQIQISDTTSEALIEKLSNYGLAYIKSSEGGSLLKSRLTSNLMMLNILWDGESYTKNLTGDDPIIIESPRVTLNLMLQLKILEDFLTGKGESARESGFFARLLMTKPKSMQGQRKYRQTGSLPPEKIDPVLGRIKSLLQRSMDRTNRNDKRSVLKISEHHADYINSFSEFIEYRIAPGGQFHDVKDAASKTRENALRIAACLHLFIDEADNQIISFDALEIGCHLALQYLFEFKKIFSEDPMQNAAEDEQELLQWIANRNLLNQSQGVRLTDIQKSGPGRLRKNNILMPALTRLWQQGRIGYAKIGNKKTIFPAVTQSQFTTYNQQIRPCNHSMNPWLGNKHSNFFVSGHYNDESINFPNNTHRDYSGYLKEHRKIEGTNGV